MIYEKLNKAWEEGDKKGAPPPVPRVLGGWAYSNDTDKNRRWNETVDWAKTYGFESLIPVLKDQEKYMTPWMTTYDVGPMGGPMYLPWNFEPKEVAISC